MIHRQIKLPFSAKTNCCYFFPTRRHALGGLGRAPAPWMAYIFFSTRTICHFFLQEQYVIAPDLKYHCFFASLKKVKLPAPKHRLLDNVCWTKVAAHILNTKWSNKSAYIVSDMPSLKTVRFLLGVYSVVLMQHYKGHEVPRPYRLCSKTETF